ncbi:MAG: PEP-CTERM sorting domain-containing protein [Bryobacteraceae bacterium]
MPFTLTGIFAITTPPGDNAVTIWPLDGDFSLGGAGTLTARFTILEEPDGGQAFRFRGITYRFEEIPEPGTAGMLLVAAPVLWLFARRRA